MEQESAEDDAAHRNHLKFEIERTDSLEFTRNSGDDEDDRDNHGEQIAPLS